MPAKDGELIILTGYEGAGKCYWCGGELPGKRRCYCCGECERNYYEAFCWIDASRKALVRENHTCQDCGLRDRLVGVHHIVPLRGGYRLWNVLNRQENLEVLCLKCHTTADRERRQWEKRGQRQLALI